MKGRNSETGRAELLSTERSWKDIYPTGNSEVKITEVNIQCSMAI